LRRHAGQSIREPGPDRNARGAQGSRASVSKVRLPVPSGPNSVSGTDALVAFHSPRRSTSEVESTGAK